MPHRLIVLEGGDGAGKTTQTTLLLDALKRAGVYGQTFDFPRYDESVYGRLVGELLKGMHGDFRHCSPYLASLPYTLDRVSARDALVRTLEEGVVVCNRYVTSNLGYQTAKLPEGERSAFVEFLEKGEYGELGIPRPDLVIYLHMPVEVATSLVGRKEVRGYMGGVQGEKDLHERDLAYQKDVVATYLDLARVRPDWHVVECLSEGVLRTPEEISEEIWGVVSHIL